MREVLSTIAFLGLLIGLAKAQTGSLIIQATEFGSSEDNKVVFEVAKLKSRGMSAFTTSEQAICQFDSLAAGHDTLEVTALSYCTINLPITILQDTITCIDVRLVQESAKRHSSGMWVSDKQRCDTAYTTDARPNITYLPIEKGSRQGNVR